MAGCRRGLLQVNMLLIYYNFIRDHMSLSMTPLKKAGLIEYNDEKYETDRWEFR
ncbi:MAG: hypothetical protein KGH61_02665 [Candidatus Micrarchaeota archaeon]|nr:hypothetical protein [Candidatus Micrarchaeota archaeon]MDE1847828.1 hypothetical protein [Candidatus Micrarchaeota archaeon]MDE1864366.1 hypothetical protein [Candidatus Micrarchaeota archaeon]